MVKRFVGFLMAVVICAVCSACGQSASSSASSSQQQDLLSGKYEAEM